MSYFTKLPFTAGMALFGLRKLQPCPELREVMHLVSWFITSRSRFLISSVILATGCLGFYMPRTVFRRLTLVAQCEPDVLSRSVFTCH